jgi:zinc protease
MQALGIAFSDNLNADTSFLNICYKINLPNNKAEIVDTAFLALGDFYNELIISENDVNQERGVILAEQRNYDSVLIRQTKKSLSFFWIVLSFPIAFPLEKWS